MNQQGNYFKAILDAYSKTSVLNAYLHGLVRRVCSRPMLVLGFVMSSTLMARETLTPLMSHALAGVPGKEVVMYTVNFPAGFSSPVHRHNAQVSVYILEGSVVMQVRGGKEMTLKPGQSFYEGPNDIHVVSRNASSTEAAKFLVFLIKKNNAPLVIPAK